MIARWNLYESQVCLEDSCDSSRAPELASPRARRLVRSRTMLGLPICFRFEMAVDDRYYVSVQDRQVL